MLESSVSDREIQSPFSTHRLLQRGVVDIKEGQRQGAAELGVGRDGGEVWTPVANVEHKHLGKIARTSAARQCTVRMARVSDRAVPRLPCPP